MSRKVANPKLMAEARKMYAEGIHKARIARIMTDRGDKVSKVTVGRWLADEKPKREKAAGLHPAMVAMIGGRHES